MTFVPVVYEHAARLIGASPWEVSRDADLMARAHRAARERYDHSPVVVGIDIYNLEAEAYGARIIEPGAGALPAIDEPIVGSPGEILRLPHPDPARHGRLPLVVKAGRILRDMLPGIDIRVPVSGPFSIASNLLGAASLVTASLTEPSMVREALLHVALGQIAFIRYCRRYGLGVTLFESAAAPPMLSPTLFEEVEYPAMRYIIAETGKLTDSAPAFVMGGDTFPVLRLILDAGVGMVIAPAETDQEEFIAVTKAFPEVHVRVNMRPEFFVTESDDRLFREADRVCRIARRRANTSVGSGILPHETDPDRVVAVKKFVESRDEDVTRTDQDVY